MRHFNKLFRRQKQQEQIKLGYEKQEKKNQNMISPKVFLNYNSENDEVYALPIKCLLTMENVQYESDEQHLMECFLLINIVKSPLRKNKSVIIKAQINGLRVINVFFEEKSYPLNKNRFNSESIIVKEEQINGYLLFPLLVGMSDKFKMSNIEVIDKLKKIIRLSNHSIVKEVSEAVVVFCGSLGYSTLRTISENQQYLLGCKTYLMIKDRNVLHGQPPIDVSTWCLNLNAKYQEVDELKAAVREWLMSNVDEENQLILVAGLGKTSSLIVPIICCESKDLGIKTSAICVMPLPFESKNIRELANISYQIVKTMCSTTYIFDTQLSNTNFDKFHRLLCCEIMKSLNTIVNVSRIDDKNKEHRIVI